jgi:hypothetical protein
MPCEVVLEEREFGVLEDDALVDEIAALMEARPKGLSAEQPNTTRRPLPGR